jgi:dephospho-CoA kinase
VPALPAETAETQGDTGQQGLAAAFRDKSFNGRWHSVIVGLTGGIATGKSTVTGMLRELGAYVVDADVWARTVVEPGSQGLSEIVATFGKEILLADGSLNRPALGKIVFHNEEDRLKLNAIIHPKIRQGMKDETETYFSTHPDTPIVWDVPLLFEGDTHKLVDVTVLVYVSACVQLERLIARDGLSEADARARIESQMPIEDKRQRADYIVNNAGQIEETRQQVEHIWANLCREAAKQ